MNRGNRFLFLLLTAASTIYAAQEPSQLTLKVGVDLVNVLFTVTDRQGRLVSGLSRTDFNVEKDGQKQDILHFSSDNELPLTLAIVIDTSPSVQPVFRAERRTAISFLRSIMRRKDLALVIGFDRSVTLMTDLTESPRRLVAAINDLDIGGGTSLYDAVYLAAHDKLTSESGRKAIILISDGEDTSSQLHLKDAIVAAHQSDSVVYSIYNSVRGRSNPRKGRSTLRTLSQETGGSVFELDREINFQPIFDQISRELRSQYSIGYKSTNMNRDGRYRQIRIIPRSSRFRIQARKGYYAPREEVIQKTNELSGMNR
jgi:VWFA-related protein